MTMTVTLSEQHYFYVDREFYLQLPIKIWLEKNVGKRSYFLDGDLNKTFPDPGYWYFGFDDDGKDLALRFGDVKDEAHFILRWL